MVDVGLKLFDPPPVPRAGQLEASHRVARAARSIDDEEIENRRE